MAQPAADTQAAAASLAAYQQATQHVRQQLVRALSAIWTGLGEYRNAQIGPWLQQVLPLILGGQQHVAALTAAYLEHQRQAAIGGAVTPAAVDPRRVTGAAVRNGTDPATVYERPFHLVWRRLGDGATPPDAIGAGLDRAVQSALTDLQLTKTHATTQVLARDRHVVGYRRELEGAYSCALCVVASTQRYHKRDLMPIHPACVPAGTTVAATGVLAVTRRWHEGHLVAISTVAGDQVTVTANHPVLTQRGWVPAGMVGEGDNVLRSRAGHRAVSGSPHERHRPASIEDVWRAASVTGLVAVPLAAEDFHGDGTDGEVDVVWTDSDLTSVGDVKFGEPVRESLLMDGHGGWGPLAACGHPAAFVPRRLAATRSGMRGSGLGGSLFGGHLRGADEAGVRVATPLHVIGLQDARDYGTRDAVFGRDAVFAAPGTVLVDDLSIGQLDPRLAAAARFDAPRVEFAGDGRLAYARVGRALLDRLAGQVELDRVVEVDRVDYSGHVYNLHTAEGWYSADSHIVSNCDCQPVPLYSNTGDEQVLDPDRLAAAHAQIRAEFGRSDAGARDIPGADGTEYRNVLVTHDHGEIGPVLSVRGRPFLGPSRVGK